MAEEDIKTDEKIEEPKILTEFEKKMQSLLDELDGHFEKIGGSYGPILMEELHRRLEHVVDSFNNEVNELFTKSFSQWKVTDTQLRDFMKTDITIPIKEPTKSKKKPVNSDTPKFIQDIDFEDI